MLLSDTLWSTWANENCFKTQRCEDKMKHKQIPANNKSFIYGYDEIKKNSPQEWIERNKPIQ